MSTNFMGLTIASMITMTILTPRMAHLLPSVSLPLALGLYGAGIYTFEQLVAITAHIVATPAAATPSAR